MNALIVGHNFIFNKKKKLSGPTMGDRNCKE